MKDESRVALFILHPSSFILQNSGLKRFGSLAGYSGGPATDSHRFPYCPHGRESAAGNLSRLKDRCMGGAAGRPGDRRTVASAAPAHYDGVRLLRLREAVRMTAGAPLTLADLEQALSAADPAALLVPPRVLRRVIKKHSGLTGPGLQVPHRKSYVIGRDALLAIADRVDLGLKPDRELPETLLLFPTPDPREAAAAAARGDAAQILAAPLPRPRPPGRAPPPAGDGPDRRRRRPRAHPPHRPGRGRRDPHRPPPGKLPPPFP